MIRSFEFCEACAAYLTIFRERYGIDGVLAALKDIGEECPVCSVQLHGDGALRPDPDTPPS